MRKLALVLVAFLLVSCAPKGQGDKSAELKEYKKLVSEYTEKIYILERELDSLPGNEKDIRVISVEILEIQAREFQSYVEVKGSIEAIQDAYISPELNGQVKQIAVKRGQFVEKGDLLIRLNTDITQNSIKELETNLALSTKIFEKQEELWKNNIGSELQFLEAKNGKEVLEARLVQLKTQLELAYIRAPFPGIVDDIMVKTGELASPGMRLIRLVNLDKMRMSAQVSESYLNYVSLNDEVFIEIESMPDQIIKSKITRIGTVIDPLTRTFVVEVQLDNNNQKLKPNMLSSMSIQDYNDPEALVVPSIVIRQDLQGDYIYKIKEDGNKTVAKKTYIETGKTIEDETQVVSGLSLNDKIIVKGFNLVSDGSPVSISN